MRSLFEKKPLVLLLSVLALGALMVLSVNLRSISFGDAQPIGREEAVQSSNPPQSVLEPARDKDLPSQIALGVAFAVLIALIVVLLSPEGRKRFIRFLVRMAITVWALYFLYNRHPEVVDFLNPILQSETRQAQNIDAGASIPPPVFTPPKEIPALSYADSLLIILGVVFIVWRAYRIWQLMNQQPAKSLQDLARMARSSLRDLFDGHETTDDE